MLSDQMNLREQRNDDNTLYRITFTLIQRRIYKISSNTDKKASLQATEKFGEHEQASTRLNFASKSNEGKIMRAVKNFNGPFITPPNLNPFQSSSVLPICGICFLSRYFNLPLKF